MPLFEIGCCASRERDEAAVEALSIVEPAGPPAKTEVEDDEVASTVGVVSADGGDESPGSVAPQLLPCHAGEEERAAPVDGGMAGDLAVVLHKAAGRLQGGRLPEWQRQWCSPQIVQRHLDARKGDVDKASEILSEALRQREEYKDVLTFTRQPVWMSDLRVLARGEDGHTCIYFCMKTQVDRPNTRATLEHFVLVHEVAVKQLRQQATTFDVVFDCHGLKISRNLDPRVGLGTISLLKHAFRDRLRLAVIVDPGSLFESLWRAFAPALPARTKDKVVMASGAEALRRLSEVAGGSVADAVSEQMRANRSESSPARPVKQPTELEEDYFS